MIHHSHEMSRPEWNHLHRVSRVITPEKGRLIENMENSLLKPTEGFRLMTQTAGSKEVVGHTLRDQINYANRLR